MPDAKNLTVWYGPMPESNGRTNWTAILHKGDMVEGFTLARSEYPERVRYDPRRAVPAWAARGRSPASHSPFQFLNPNSTRTQVSLIFIPSSSFVIFVW